MPPLPHGRHQAEALENEAEPSIETTLFCFFPSTSIRNCTEELVESLEDRLLLSRLLLAHQRHGMAGIGEATAIIAVAQIGITFSKTIFEFAAEIKNAPKAICRIEKNICTTSEKLEEVGRLIKKNNTTHLSSKTGIASAVRCSNDCKDIIADVNKMLAKRGWIPGSADPDKKDLNVSLFEALR